MLIYLGFSAAYHQIPGHRKGRLFQYQPGDLLTSRLTAPSPISGRAHAWFLVTLPLDLTQIEDVKLQVKYAKRVRDAYLRATGFRRDEGAPPMRLNFERLKAKSPAQATLIQTMLDTPPEPTAQEKSASALAYRIQVIENREPTEAELQEIAQVPFPYVIPEIDAAVLLDCMTPVFVEERAAMKEQLAQIPEQVAQRKAAEAALMASENETLATLLGEADPLCAATCEKLRKDAQALLDDAEKEQLRCAKQAEMHRSEKGRLMEKSQAQKERYDANA